MKAAPKVVFLFNDADGFGSSIYNALQPKADSTLRRSENSFDLSLARYGIKDYRASGEISHFVDANGIPEVSILLLQNYEVPVLACAINEVIESLAGESLLSKPMLILPFFLAASIMKLESNISARNNIIYGIRKGPETEITQALVTRTQKPPSSFQIYHEALSCIHQFIHVLNMPAFILIGRSRLNIPQKASGKELEVICEIGEILSSVLSLCFVSERIRWSPIHGSKENNEQPWRALYG